MRVLSRDGSTSGLGKAIAELGHVAKTLYSLGYLDVEPYRRRIQTQLNRGVRLERCYRSAMERQLRALGWR